MGKHYLYMPFTDWEDDKAFRAANAHYEWKYGVAAAGTARNKHGEGHTDAVIQGGRGLIGWFLRPLKIVANDDVLVVMGHGNWGNAGTVSVEKKQWGWGIQMWENQTVDDLAAQLEREGLDRGHKVVKLISCWGGAATQFKYDAGNNSFVASASRASCTASLLAAALGPKYRNIVVGGFLGMGGMNSDPTIQNTTGYEYHGGPPANGSELNKWFGTKGNVAWYGPDGKQTTRPKSAT